jgi:hypothetical protein
MHFKDVLPFKGPVKLKNPDNRWWVLEDAGLPEMEEAGESDVQSGNKNKKNNKNIARGGAANINDNSSVGNSADGRCRHVFVVREVRGCGRAMGHRGARDNIDRFSLKKRKYLGPTSMDVELALLMVNMCMARKGDYVMDPFAGTGSVLVALGAFGAQPCFGADIDVRVLRGEMGVDFKKQKAKEAQQKKQREQREQRQQQGETTNAANSKGDQNCKKKRKGGGAKQHNEENNKITDRGVLANFRQYKMPRPGNNKLVNRAFPLFFKCSCYSCTLAPSLSYLFGAYS